jgi:hypothetical protein
VVASLSSSSAVWLGIYATTVSTAVALLTLYGELFLRIGVRARETFMVKVAGGRNMSIAGEAAIEDIGIPKEGTRPIMLVEVRNRGRQTVQIQKLAQGEWIRRPVFDEPFRRLPLDLAPGHSETFELGVEHPYAHGTYSTRRIFIVDGAGRVHPLRERWRQRFEDLAYRSLVLFLRRRKRRRSSRREL